MDTTETYIKMCEKAKEIQLAFKTTEPINYALIGSGHFVAHWYRGDRHKYIAVLGDSIEIDRCHWCLFRPNEGQGSHTPERYHKLDELFCWLPRQDQLQEMVKRPIPNLLFCIQRHWGEMKFPHLPISMEQLWLAFVMKEKYNKVWDGEKWATT